MTVIGLAFDFVFPTRGIFFRGGASMFYQKVLFFFVQHLLPVFTEVFLTKSDYSNGRPVSTNWSSSVPYKN